MGATEYRRQRILESFISDLLIGKALIFAGGGVAGFYAAKDNPEASVVGVGIAVV